MIEERTQPTGAYISYTIYFFVQFFHLTNYSLRDPIYICPRFFLFATPFCDSHSRPTFATPFCDSHLRLTFATRVCDHTDSRSRLLIAPPTATRSFFVATSVVRLHHCGWTVLTPQHHLPSVPTLTLFKKIWNLLPGLASTSSYYPPSCPPPPVALCPLTRPLAQHPLQRPLHLLPGPLPTSPPLSHPLNLPLFPLYGNMSLMF